MFTVKKDPEAVLDYTINWTAWLDGDTILTSVWTVPTGITKDSESNTTLRATAWLSGGTDGTNYIVVNTIVTAAGRTDERSVVVYVRDR